MPKPIRNLFIILFVLVLVIGCNLPINPPEKSTFTGISPILTETAAARALLAAHAIPTTETRGYLIQSGDTLPALAKRFGRSEEEMALALTPVLRGGSLSTLPASERVDILLPDGYEKQPLLHIIPNNYFVYGPTQADFDVDGFVASSPGWLKNYVDHSGAVAVTGTRIVKGTAENYSISPRILLALLELRLGALSNPNTPTSFSLGSSEPQRRTLGKHLSWAANTLNNGYYGWRDGSLLALDLADGSQRRINPADNAGSVAIAYYFSRYLDGEALSSALSPEGFVKTYYSLFGPVDWEADIKDELIPVNLQQPALGNPLQSELKWAYTGGPHSGWGSGIPYAAIDFAPPATTAGCDSSPYKVFSASEGVISRADAGFITVDLDGDGISATGWTIDYVHLAPVKNFSIGERIQKGDALGYPSCLGGESTGRNVHIARRYNGEWIPVDGVIPLDMGGWRAFNGEKEYKGTLTRGSVTLRSSNVGEWFSQMPVEQ